MLQVDLFEEEDFSPQDYGLLDQGCGMPHVELMALLQHAEAMLGARAVSCGEGGGAALLSSSLCLPVGSKMCRTPNKMAKKMRKKKSWIKLLPKSRFCPNIYCRSPSLFV